jgi:hypothetical protein
MLMHCNVCRLSIEIDAHFQCATDNTPSTWELEMTSCPECGSDLEIDDQPTVPINPHPTRSGKAQRRPVTVSKTKLGVKSKCTTN